MERIRVLMFGWEFPPHNSGGLGVACQGLTRALSADHVEVTFVLPRRVELPGENFRFADDEKYGHVRLRTVDSFLVPYSDDTSYKKGLSSLALSGMYASRLAEEVRLYAERAAAIAQQEDFDIIHAHDWLSFGAGITAKQVSGKPLVVHVHATEFDRTGGNGVNQEVYQLERQGMEQADHVVAVSEFTKQTIINKYDIDAKKITAIHNGTDTDHPVSQEANSPERPTSSLQHLRDQGFKIVSFVGRITIQKGPDYFLQAAAKVLQTHPNIIFVMAGSGDMMNQMIELAAQLQIADKVLFPGFARGDERTAVYSDADLFVMPSVSEPFGLVPLEALHAGTPVLVSKQSGVSEVLAHALKTDFWDVDDMADKIIAALYHPALAEQLTQEGQKEAHGLSWQKAANKVKSLYQKVLDLFRKKPDNDHD